AHNRVVAALQRRQQLARLVEEPLYSRPRNHGPQHGDSQVGLAHARMTKEQEAALSTSRVRIDEAARLGNRIEKGVVVRPKIVERAVLIALGNVRIGEPRLADLLAPALAADHAADACRWIIDRPPAGGGTIPR